MEFALGLARRSLRGAPRTGLGGNGAERRDAAPGLDTDDIDAARSEERAVAAAMGVLRVLMAAVTGATKWPRSPT